MRTRTILLLSKYYWKHMESARDNKDLPGEKVNLIKYNTVKEMALELDILTEREITEHREHMEHEFYVVGKKTIN